MAGGSLKVKLVEKAYLDLFTEDALQSVDRSHGKVAGNLRKQHDFEAVEEIPEDDDDATCNDDLNENDNAFVDEDGNLLATEEIVSDIDGVLAIDDEEYHEARLGYREERDQLKEGPCCSRICSVETKTYWQRKNDPSSVRQESEKQSSLKTS